MFKRITFVAPMYKNIPIPEFSSIAFTILKHTAIIITGFPKISWIELEPLGPSLQFLMPSSRSESPFSSGLLEDRANGVWQDGSHRRRAEADNAKLVLEDRGSDTTTPLNWNLKSIRAAPHPLAGGGGEKKRKMEKKEDWYPGKSN